MKKRYNYKRLIIKELFYNQVLSSTELSPKIGKSLPLTIRIIDELLEDHILVETGLAPSSGGRRPTLYSLQKSKMYIVAVAMDQLVTRISLIDVTDHNKFLLTEKFELPLFKNDQVLSVLAQKINAAIKKSGIVAKNILGVGIGMPGFIDSKKGINYSFIPLTESTIIKFLSRELQLPVYIDNDSSLIGLAELKFGSAKNLKNVMVINIGWGVGLGTILNGELFRGHNGFAGEFSHIPIFNNNKLCQCGKTGCLETETSLSTIIERAALGLKEGRLSSLSKNFPSGSLEKDWDEIVEAARNGDRFAVELFSVSGYNIGRGVAILIHILNPEQVILSGRGALAGKVWLPSIQQALNEHCIPRLGANTSISISTLGYNAELMGSAALVMENYSKNNHKTSDTEIQVEPFFK